MLHLHECDEPAPAESAAEPLHSVGDFAIVEEFAVEPLHSTDDPATAESAAERERGQKFAKCGERERGPKILERGHNARRTPTMHISLFLVLETRVLVVHLTFYCKGRRASSSVSCIDPKARHVSFQLASSSSV
jgi:hypothetical protein